MDEQENLPNLENKEEKTRKKSEKKTLAKPGWVKISREELEKIVIELGKKGESPAKIGLILRDQHGVPKARVLGKRIEQILKENKINYKTDKTVFQERVARLKEHITKHKHDTGAARALTKNLWAVHRISKQLV